MNNKELFAAQALCREYLIETGDGVKYIYASPQKQEELFAAQSLNREFLIETEDGIKYVYLPPSIH